MKLLLRSITGILMLMISTSSLFAQVKKINRQDKNIIIQKAILLLNENYIFPERVQEIKTYVEKRLNTGGYDSINNPQDFLKSLNNDLEQKGNDHHLNIFYGPERVKQIASDEKNEKEGRAEKLTEIWLKKLQYENFRLRKLERLDGNIGYFNFLSFTPLEASRQSIIAAMNFILYSNAIIIDLRDNGGGNAETMNFLLSYFLQDSVQISEFRYRKENEVLRTYTTTDNMINKIPDSIPVYILVSNRTSSAAEGFAYSLQQYKRATVIGEQTKGEGNPGRLFAINDELYMMIPTAEAINPVSKKSIDGIGVIPDIKIQKDKALTKALLEVNSLLAAKSLVKELKLLYQWQIPLLENQLAPESLTQNVISSLIGKYEDGKKIVYENGSIFYINTKGEKEKLEYIGNGVFQNAGKSWLRLVMPFYDKPVPFFKWTWDDGGEPQLVKRQLPG